MVEVLSRQEDIPASYPEAPGALSEAAAALDPAIIWQRIEACTAHRWTPREVTWIVQAPGCWSPDLAPVVLDKAETWQTGAWAMVTLEASPMGGWILLGDGLLRFVGSIGGGDVPATVVEAFRRLVEYSAADPGTHGASDYKVDLGPISEEFHRS